MHIMRLNIRHTLPQIGMRSQINTLSSHVVPAETHTRYQAPKSNQQMTQSRIDINTYPSRHAYGYTNNTDFAREHGSRGLQEMREGMSRRNQQAQAMVKGAAKKGHNEIAAQAKQELSRHISKERRMEVQGIPDPEISGTPAQLSGGIDPGECDWTAQTQSRAAVNLNPGNFEGEFFSLLNSSAV